MSPPRRTIVILQRVLPHYRVALFRRLAERLSAEGLRLRVVYGQERPGTVPQTVHPQESWAEFTPNIYFGTERSELVWQRALRHVGGSDLVIVEQANRLLINYLLLVRRKLGHFRIAFWGHGRNRQSRAPEGWREGLKRGLVAQVDWWFAYTQRTGEFVTSTGFPEKRCTVVENTIDSTAFSAALKAVTCDEIEAVKRELGLTQGPVALFCGGMYADKRIGFLLEAASILKSRVPGLQLIMVGSGPDAHLAEAGAAGADWIHYLGPTYGDERAVYFAMSDVLLMPGLVGLAIVDSFIAGVPLATTDIPFHSPEVDYLEHGGNGLKVAPDAHAYADAVAGMLTNEVLRQRLREGCAVAAERYTLDNMVERFAAGILACTE